MRFEVQLSYYRAETTRHMHISDEATIKDEGGRPVIGTDCVLWPRHRVMLVRVGGSIWAKF